jgi:hypothetical protein
LLKFRHDAEYGLTKMELAKGIRRIMGHQSTFAALLIAFAASLSTSACSDNADSNGDGTVSKDERAVEMTRDGYLAIKPGRWQTDVQFSDIDVPQLSPVQRQQIVKGAGKKTSRFSCLSEAEAARPGPDFFGGAGAENCSYKQFDIAGNKAQMTLLCQLGGMGRAEIELDGTVNSETFVFDTNVVMEVPMIGKSRKIKMTGTMNGKFAGTCQGNE